MNKSTNRKHSIIITAINTVSDIGFQGLTTKEIAKREGISEATLYKHFKDKDEILFAAAEYYCEYDFKAKERLNSDNFSPREGIVFFLKTIAEYYEAYPQLTAFMSAYGTIRSNPWSKEKYKNRFDDRANLIKNLVESGVNHGEFKSDLNSEYLTDAILGAFRTIIQRWTLNDFSFPLGENVVAAVEMPLNLAK